MNNQRRNRILIIGRESMTLTEAAIRFNIAPRTLWKRLEAGWTIEDSLGRQVGPTKLERKEISRNALAARWGKVRARV